MGWEAVAGVIGGVLVVYAVLLVLRSVISRAGADAVRQHWPGTPDGLAVMLRLAGLGTPA